MNNDEALQPSDQQPKREWAGLMFALPNKPGHKREHPNAIEDVSLAWDMAHAGKSDRDEAAEAREIGSEYVDDYEKTGHPGSKAFAEATIKLVQKHERLADQAENSVLNRHQEVAELRQQLGIKQPDDDK